MGILLALGIWLSAGHYAVPIGALRERRDEQSRRNARRFEGRTLDLWTVNHDVHTQNRNEKQSDTYFFDPSAVG